MKDVLDIIENSPSEEKKNLELTKEFLESIVEKLTTKVEFHADMLELLTEDLAYYKNTLKTLEEK